MCCLAGGRSLRLADHHATLQLSPTPSSLCAVQLLLGRTATGAGGSSEVLAAKLANTLCSRAIKTLPAILQQVRALAPLEQVRAVNASCKCLMSILHAAGHVVIFSWVWHTSFAACHPAASACPEPPGAGGGSQSTESQHHAAGSVVDTDFCKVAGRDS